MLSDSLDVSTKRLYTRHTVESSKRMACLRRESSFHVITYYQKVIRFQFRRPNSFYRAA